MEQANKYNDSERHWAEASERAFDAEERRSEREMHDDGATDEAVAKMAASLDAMDEAELDEEDERNLLLAIAEDWRRDYTANLRLNRLKRFSSTSPGCWRLR